MAGRSKPIFVGAWLLGAVGVVSLAQAKSGRAWSDPPPDLNAGPLTTDFGSGGSQLREAQDWPDEAARRRPSSEVARPSRTPDVNETGSIQTAGEDAERASAARQLRIKQAAARKAREKQVALAQAEAARQEREKQIALAEAEAARKQREKQAEKTRKEQEVRVAARARMVAAAREQRKTAAQQVAEAQPSTPQPTDYQVMRLRTLLFPDGRTVQVLTRPEQETVDLPLR